MVLLKLNSKKSSDKPVPEQLPALPSHDAKQESSNKVPDTLPDLNKPKDDLVKQQPAQQPQPTTQTQPQTQPTQQQNSQPQVQQQPQPTTQTQPQTQPTQQQNSQPQVQREQKQYSQPTQSPTQQVVDKNSFSSRLQSLVDQNEDDEHKKAKFKSLLKNDLFNTLEDFHESVDSGRPYILHKDEIKSIIHDKLENLKIVEQNWHAKKEQLKALQKQVDSDETKLKKELRELKELMNNYVENKIGEDKHFYLSNNESVASISELKEKLPSMNVDVFSHHVNATKNDFADWIEHVFNYKSLADKIRPVKSKEELIKILNE